MAAPPPFPRAILHFDGDAFFASIEQLMDYTLRGKPVVTGGERGAATSISYEAKARGIHRGMPMREIKRICPDVHIVSSDYTAYSIYARRMYGIVREYTPYVEEYSIDECFADVTGLRAKYGRSYEEIGLMIKSRLEADLGLTFGVGLAPNKTLAKLASKHRKPAGFTSIPLHEISTFLKDLYIGNIWGMGMKTSLYLEKLGIHTALDFAQRDEAWLRVNKLSKPYREIWSELHGSFARPLALSGDGAIGSIMKTRTFTPSRNRAVILSQLAKNIEDAAAKARRHGVQARSLRFYLKTQEFRYAGIVLTLPVSLTDPRELIRIVEAHLDEAYVPGELYRATGVTLSALTADHAVTPDLFGESERIEERASVIGAIDRLNDRFGRHTVFLGASMTALAAEDVASAYRAARGRKKVTLPIERRRKSLNIPYLGIAH